MNNPLRMCMNPKVIGGLVAVGVLIFIFAPGVAVAAIPLLLLAACPLSMLFMGGMMMGGKHEAPAGTGAYYCAMHPKVSSEQPGRCPECGMALVKNSAASNDGKPELQEQVGQLEAEVRDLREKLTANGGNGTRR